MQARTARNAGPTLVKPAPIAGARELLAALQPVVDQVAGAGWQINLAIETGGDVERLTFSAARLNLGD